MIEHPCAKGIKTNCFKAYPSWSTRALAYRVLYTLVPINVIRLLKIDLHHPLIAPEATLPQDLDLPPGWVVFPDVKFPPGWTIKDPLPGGVFPPPVFSPLLPETGGSAPLFVQPWEPGPIKQSGLLTSGGWSLGTQILSGGTGDSPQSLGDTPERSRIGVVFLLYQDARVGGISIKIGREGAPNDYVRLEIWSEGADQKPSSMVPGGNSEYFHNLQFPSYVDAIEPTTFRFLNNPLISSSINHYLVILRTGQINAVDYYKIRCADLPGGYFYFSNQAGVWGDRQPLLLEYLIYGTNQ